MIGPLLRRFAGQGFLASGLGKSLVAGAPGWGDLAMNALPSALYGVSMLQQGANPMEAAGTAGFDLGLQMGFDTVAGTAGAAIGRKFAPARIREMTNARARERLLNRRSERFANPAKMASMVTMLIPNPVAQGVYDRKEKEYMAAQGLSQPPGSGDMLMQPQANGTDAYAYEPLDQYQPDSDPYEQFLIQGAYG